ncbi:MAG: hypothetical protein H6818_07720 [Phycisphaerales bacterium]|nr:hypothetical protein [Phycisphaerales bacterium]MCB9864213.1 hypothetical protein [Phycisphaerales bacterium]
MKTHDDIDAEWFELRDDEELGTALKEGLYRGCLFADLDAAMDAAVAGRIRLDEIGADTVDLRMARGPSDASGMTSIRLALRSAARTAAARRQAETGRQTIAGMVLSAVLLAAIAGLLLIRRG